MTAFKLTIFGEPASKANSRKLVQFGDRPAIIKSEKARDFEANALKQIPPALRVAIECDVRVTLRIFYATKRPDLDESVILDVLQNRWKGKAGKRVLVQRGVYANDRQVREKHVYHGIDRDNPRTEILIEPIELTNNELFDRGQQKLPTSTAAKAQGVPF